MSEERVNLEKQLIEIQGQIHQNINREINMQRLGETKTKIAKLVDVTCRGVMIRAKIEKIELDEKSTKLFFSREHTKGEKGKSEHF